MGKSIASVPAFPAALATGPGRSIIGHGLAATGLFSYDEAKEKADRYTPPTDYRNNLIKFVSEARAKKAIPVLLTPIMRRKFDKEGKLRIDTSDEIVKAALLTLDGAVINPALTPEPAVAPSTVEATPGATS